MPPTLILIRHAEALHNVNREYHIPDPELSLLGLQQCKDLRDHLRQHLPLADEAELVVVSPMRRTLQTALGGLDWLIKKGVRVRVDALWQENSDKPCDTGSPIPKLQQEFTQVDFSDLDATYPEKRSPKDNIYRFTRSAVVARGQSALASLYDRPEKVIIVVSHSGFLRCAVSGRRYANADYRVFEFVEKYSRGQYELKERESTEGSGGMGRSEKGVAGIVETDFPEEEALNGVEEKLGERTQKEAVAEVPKN
ncbi:uncharacterized protein K452DRAFT_287404 [Aplosporella prunicola CBS 121167]|uniref:Phosphoglycerate mutase-like protein n=1 Tax=Aplosporella prunicola CBS 121167 TaxID=1176127 RepID=A0A6A6BFV7_9PEZI|nr:uncharacterized protein K452DRAFT_287404 [Aplosporella prunicola CBS 121167]KAF2142185.1 hypothetical protein K452DRAFT_287404 [Aplosporella prunicola CBS 121167]